MSWILPPEKYMEMYVFKDRKVILGMTDVTRDHYRQE